jgi:hypothetical protein
MATADMASPLPLHHTITVCYVGDFSESFLQHDERHVVPTLLSGIRVGKEKELRGAIKNSLIRPCWLVGNEW